MTLGKILVIVGVAWFLLAFGSINYRIQEGRAKERACASLGMELINYETSDYCVDILHQAHYVNFDCEGIIFVECEARLFSIGDNRVKVIE